MCDKKDMPYFEQLVQEAELYQIAAKAVDARPCAGIYDMKTCRINSVKYCSMAEFCRARRGMK